MTRTTAKLALISGSTRADSSNGAVLLTVPDVLGDEIVPLTFLDPSELPHFNPDHDTDPLPAEVVRLRALIAEADALLFCTPEYAGNLPGSFKNLLDWTVGGSETSDKPSAWINSSASPTGAAGAHAALRTVLGYTGAKVVDAACAHIPVTRDAIDAETGLITDLATRAAIAEAVRTLTAAAAPA